MGRSGELWDDSALINAFDEAICKYKMMHGKGEGNAGSLKDINITNGTQESSGISFDGKNEAKSGHAEADNNTSALLENMTNPGEAENSLSTEKHPPVVVDQYLTPSNGEQVQDTNNTYDVNALSTEDYNDLLSQYNSVEEQRQKILQQLYQYGNWDYQGYGYDSQDHPVTAAQAPCPDTVCSCRSYVCPHSTAPCPTLAAVFPCTCDGSSAFAHNGGFIKAAMGAVDRAICSFKAEMSGVPEADNEEKKGQEAETSVGMVTPPTDLSVVLNAWFSAGFYTGKYLSEQASAKK